MLLNSLIFTLLFCSSSSLNILVYSPAYAASHSNFLGKLADTLTERGHNVTYLMPVMDPGKRDECIGVKLTKDLVIVEADEEMMSREEGVTLDEEIMELYWKSEMDSSNSRDMFSFFNNAMKAACRNFLKRRDIFEQMKSRNFDVAIVEPLSVCGLGFVKALGIEKTILASSCTFYDSIMDYIGEPLDFSYVPALFSVTGDVMTMSERYENWMVTKEINIGIHEKFDDEMKSYREFLGQDLPDWRELLSTASIFFINSNPFFDFPRPVLQKTVPIGGISVNLKWIKEQKLTKDWEEVLEMRKKTVLISFGSLVKSAYMPKKWRNGLLDVIKSMPDVTFIWKYETDDVSFADGVSNIHFSKWVPQTALLNDPRLSVFVTHGGLGSTMELAYSGKPAVVIPVFADQIRNANMIARHRGVIYLHKNSMENVKVTRKAFTDVLFDDSYQKNAEKLANILMNQPYSPKENVIKYTEFLGEHGPFPNMDPHGRHLNYFQKTFLDIYTLFALFYIFVSTIIIVTIRFVYKFTRKHFILVKSKEN
ncbi:glucuronosyltransferase [Caenorhabditis elegans]|uniref:glucuronosyltransferase n=1 Tax=Caenorhabditis elegans TaxID=6239 RepID=H2L0C9_CAEEL|nr:glucuronosyltransferase [Caenorhabditis elegans]CCD72462.1 glucuronosyltransferase [Caenorhabditis elegans]|eukprot:NP_503298.1 UDP-GlucuronosylTransferase [Caenorhabditis elegans]